MSIGNEVAMTDLEVNPVELALDIAEENGWESEYDESQAAVGMLRHGSADTEYTIAVVDFDGEVMVDGRMEISVPSRYRRHFRVMLNEVNDQISGGAFILGRTTTGLHYLRYRMSVFLAGDQDEARRQIDLMIRAVYGILEEYRLVFLNVAKTGDINESKDMTVGGVYGTA